MREKIEEIEHWLQQDLFQLLSQFQNKLDILRAEKASFWQKRKMEEEKKKLYHQNDAIDRFIGDELLFLTNVRNYFSEDTVLSEKEYNDRKIVYPKIMAYHTNMKKLSTLPEKDLVLCLMDEKERLKRDIHLDRHSIVLSSKRKTDAELPYEKEVLSYLQKFLTTDSEQKNPYQSMEDILLNAIDQNLDYQKYQELAKIFFIQKEKNKLTLDEKNISSKYSKETLLKAKRAILSILFKMKNYGEISNQEALIFESDLAAALAAVTCELKDSSFQTLK